MLVLILLLHKEMLLKY